MLIGCSVPPAVRFHRLTSVAFVAALSAGCSGSPTRPTPPVTPPATPSFAITCPGNLTTRAREGSTVAVSFATPAVTGGVNPIQVSCTRQSGSLFGVGQTSILCTAVDSTGQSASCQFSVIVNALPPILTSTKFLAFGDSLTAGELTVTATHPSRQGETNFPLAVVPASSYPTQLANLLRNRYTTQAQAIQVTNAGLPGETTQNGAKRLPGVLMSTRPEVVILLEGVNDVGTQADFGVSAAATGMTAMVREARGRGARVILATEPPSRPGFRAVSTQFVTAYNDRLRLIAAAEGALLVDLYAGMAGDVTRYIGVDGLHPTEAGYARMAELILQVIRQNLEER
jgi:lysophospholipase L1-like esterase